MGDREGPEGWAGAEAGAGWAAEAGRRGWEGLGGMDTCWVSCGFLSSGCRA